MSASGKPVKSPVADASAITHAALAIPLAVVSGCLVFLSFPTYDLFPLQWVSLVPLLFAARGRGLRGGLLMGFLAGLATNVGGFYWIAGLLGEFGHMGPAPSIALMVLVAAYQAIPAAMATGIAAAFTRRFGQAWWFLVFPVLFTATEFLVPFIFPWYFANGQQRFYAVTQVVEILGVSGLTFLLVLVNCAVFAVIDCRLGSRRFPAVRVIAATALLIAAVVFGLVRIRATDDEVRQARKFRISMVEADVGIWEKEAQQPDGSPLPWAEQVDMLYRNLLKHQFMTARVERDDRPDLVVWPESSYIPLHEVYARRSDAFAVAAGPWGRTYYVTAGGTRQVEGGGRKALGATGIRGVASGREGIIFGVGARGSVYVHDGTSWSREPSGADRDLYAVSVIEGTGKAMAVGSQGTAVARIGGTWRPVELGTSMDLYGVTRLGKTGFVACGAGGTLIEWDGRRAVRLDAGTVQDLLAVSWSEDGGLVATGRAGTMVRVRGGRASAVETGTTRDLNGVASGADTIVVGDDGLVLSCTARCVRLKSGTRQDLVAVSSDWTSRAFAVGAEGAVLEVANGSVRKVGPAGDVPAPKSLTSVAWIPMTEGYPLPRDVSYVYASPVPLPAGDESDPALAVEADRETPAKDRNAAIRGFSTPMIFGAITYGRDPERDGEREYYNTALLVGPDGEVQGRYDKNYLLIFGEHIPMSDWFPFLKSWLPEAGDYRSGTSVQVFEVDGVRIGLMICYEDIIPSFTRKLADEGPNVLINITNDAWFGRTSEPYQHLQLAAFRAIENRRYLLRSTNTGVSAVVDPVGRIVSETSLTGAETLTADVAVLDGSTTYQRYGDVFAWACCALGLLAVASTRIRKRKGK